MNQLAGKTVVTDPNLTERYEFWGFVRSPSRAKRRMKKHRQAIQIRYRPIEKIFEIPGNIVVMHPEIWKKICEAAK